jgi:protein-S-isoprenylcysteine O-methyltransferase Ste14
MKFDLRLPIGILFTIYGVLLVVFGLTSDPKIYERSLGININLRWGLLLLLFGLAMLFLAWRGHGKTSKPPGDPKV